MSGRIGVILLRSTARENPHLMQKLSKHRLHLSCIRYLVVHRARPGLDFQCSAQRIEVTCACTTVVSLERKREARPKRTSSASLLAPADPSRSLGSRRSSPCSDLGPGGSAAALPAF